MDDMAISVESDFDELDFDTIARYADCVCDALFTDDCSCSAFEELLEDISDPDASTTTDSDSLKNAVDPLYIEDASEDRLAIDATADVLDQDPFYPEFIEETPDSSTDENAIDQSVSKRSLPKPPVPAVEPTPVIADVDESPEEDPDYFVGHPYTKEELATIRGDLTTKLSGVARFVRLKPGTKVSVGRFDDANTSKIIPLSTDYGIIPKKNLLVLDIDAHTDKETTTDEQISMFSEFLGVDLRKSFTVATPSGGFHTYLLIPEHLGQLASGLQNLNVYQSAFSKILGRDVVVDSDLRTGKSAGYIVGPTSAYTHLDSSKKNVNKTAVRDFYRVADESDGFSADGQDAGFLYISETGFDRLCQLRDVKKDILDEELAVIRAQKAGARKNSSSASKAKKSTLSESDQSVQSDSLPAAELIRKLEREMRSRTMVTFHQKRSFVKAALHCCHTDTAIAQVCIDFNIDRDSASQDKISYRELLRDLARFSPSDSFHGGYCVSSSRQSKLTGSNFTSEDQGFDVVKFREKNAEKVANRTVSRHKPGYHSRPEPRVLDVSKISQRLLEGSKRKNPSQQYFDAMSVVDYFLQPLSNVGAKTVLLARTAIEERLQLSSSRAAQALRILRDRGVVSVVDKQKTGLAPTYTVDESFVHVKLTRTIRMLWGFNGVPLATGEVDEDGNLKKTHANLYLDRHSGVFREVFTDKIVESNFALVSSWIHTMNTESKAESSPSFGPGAASSYLKREAKERGLTVVGGTETLIVEESTGEVISTTDVSKAPTSSERTVKARSVQGRNSCCERGKPYASTARLSKYFSTRSNTSAFGVLKTMDTFTVPP